MKKFNTILIVILTLFCGVIFSACKNNYRFSMEFYLADSKISTLNLYIDENGDAEPQHVSVKFSRIKSKKINPLEISVDQQGVADISNAQLSGTTYSFDVTALAPTSDANLTIRHLSSNKSASIKLNIEKRASTVQNLNKTYVIGIPDVGSAQANINAEQLFNFDGTEKVYYVLANNSSLPDGVTPIYETINNTQVIAGFNVASTTSSEAGDVLLNPVFYIPNFYLETKTDLVVRVKFLSLLNNDKVELQINNNLQAFKSDAYQDMYEQDKPIVLLYNDDNFKSLLVHFDFSDPQNFKKYYSAPTLQTLGGQTANKYSLALAGADNSYIITATSVDDYSLVDFAFKPNDNYVGEIETFNVGLRLSSKKRATDVEVYKDDTLVESDELSRVELFDKYYDNFNIEKLGAKFNFAPNGQDSGIADFNYMRLVVPIGELYINDEVNNIFSSHGFDQAGNETFDLPTTTNSLLETNKNLLQIYLGARPMRFYIDSSNRLISELFTADDDVYIKSCKNSKSGDLGEINLSLGVQTVYKYAGSNLTQDYAYFNNSTARPFDGRIITFITQDAVTGIEIKAGQLQNGTINYFDGLVNNVSIEKNDSNVYVLKINSVSGVDSPITNTNFNLAVEALDGQNSLVKFKIGESGEELTEVGYKYGQDDELYLSIAAADLGHYNLTILHESGKSFVVPIFIYEDVKLADINYQLDLDSGLDLKNEQLQNGGKKYDVDADYLVPADENRKLGLYVENNQKFNLTYNNQPFYSFSLDFGMQYNAGEGVNLTNRTAQDFVNTINFTAADLQSYNSVFGNYLTFKTNANNEAGYFEGGKNYVVATLKLKKNYSFENILAEPTADVSDVEQDIKFFIYKKFNRSQLSIQFSNLDVYYADYLGYNFIEQADTTLNLVYTNDNDIWNYVDNISWATDRTDEKGSIFSLEEAGASAELRFIKHADNNYFTFSATISQFDVSYTVTNSIYVKTPTITSDLTVDNVNYDYRGNYYLDLKLGETLDIDYRATSYGEITNPGVEIYVISRINNGIDTSYQISVSTASVSISDNRRVSATANERDISLLIVASDVLASSPVGSYNSLDGFVSKFINPDLAETNPYLDAYKIIDLYITDGLTEQTAFVVDSLKDFEELNNYKNQEKYFVLLNDINLINLTSPIEDFAGHLFSQKGYSFSLNVLLDDKFANVFENITEHASLVDINFQVEYRYKEINNPNLGVIGENAGELSNVTVDFFGDVKMDNTASFGALVGVNSGEISYSSNRAASSGRISIKGGGALVFGALVGENSGSITGVNLLDEQTEKKVVFASSAYSGATADVNINSSLTNSSSAIGGLVGLNSGKITDVFVTGNIQATYNVGGIIGKNVLEQKTAQITLGADGTISSIDLDQFEINNAISQVKIVASKYVGGVVGYDEFGRFNNCAYQIFTPNQVAITGNSEVGGFAGYSNNGWFKYCYVYSYRWNYDSLNSIAGQADILGKENVAGFIGQAVSAWDSITLGSANTANCLVISNCSVNAYISASDPTGSTVGLTNILTVGQGEQHSAIVNAYFIGVLGGQFENATDTSLVLTNIQDNEDSSAPVYTRVYSVNYNVNTLMTYTGQYPSNFENQTVIDSANWAVDENGIINGGYIYLIKDNKPLFELAPQTLSATSKENSNAFRAFRLDYKTVYLNYYNFSLDANEPNYQNVYDQLQDSYNTYSIIDLFDLTNWKPEDIKVLQLTTSKNGNCLDIVNGNIVVRGVGTAQITFTSLLNPSAQVSVDIIVGYPFGNNLTLKETVTSFAELSNLGVGKNQTKEVLALFEGRGGLENNTTKTYPYQTNSSIRYIVTVDALDETAGFEEFVKNNLLIGGLNLKQQGGKWTTITDNLVFSVKAEYRGRLNVSVTPIIEISWQNGQKSQKIPYSTTKTFTLVTLEGATKVEMQSRGGVVYPNTVLDGSNSFEVDILTDFAYTEEQLDFISEDGELNIYISIDGERINFAAMDVNIKDIIDFERDRLGNKLISYKEEQQKQTIKFNIKFAEFEKLIDKSSAHKILFEFEINHKMGSVVFNLSPQQIYSVNLRNYIVNYNEDNSFELEESSLLYLNEFGAIVIDMYPQNGYFEFLEIRDITANADALIKFIQVNHNLTKDNVQIGDDLETDDGLGIVLNKNAFKDDNYKIYALTQILARQSEINHQIEVIAYVGNFSNKLEVGRSVIDIQIRLQPIVDVDYLRPDGATYITANNGETEKTNEIAYGTNVEFAAHMQDVDSLRVSFAFADNSLNANEYFNLVQLNNGHYRLNSIRRDISLIGKEILIRFTGVRVTNSGEELTTITGFKLKITWYKVFGISIYRNSHRVGNDLEVYGNFNAPINLEFYFAPTDVSYYSYPNTEFRFNSQFDDEGAQSLVNILKQLNGLATEDRIDPTELLTWYTQTEQGLAEVEETVLASEDNDYRVVITRAADEAMQLLVRAEYKIYGFELKFRLEEDANGYKRVVALDEEHNVAEFVLSASLNFQRITSSLDPILIDDAAKFISMAGPQSDYILGCDLTFDENNPYTPFDLDVASFDGNGHTIYISDFALPEGNTINAGLFTSISSNSLVQNVQVEYNLGKISVGNNLFAITGKLLGDENGSYSSINFGGIAVQNNGIITNCKVKGCLAVSQSNIDISAITQTGDKNIPPFNIGGVAYINGAQAYISNTVSELKIAAMANTGAVVHTNNGTIVSSYYNATDDAGLMYIYQTQPVNDASDNPIGLDADSAAFVLNNNGKIDMCYVVAGKTHFVNGDIGNLSANNDFAGFVFKNNASITNCYTNIELIGRSEGQFAGFVYDNGTANETSSAGIIQNCYTYVNAGEALDRRYFAFTSQANEGTLEHCYTIKVGSSRGNDSTKIEVIPLYSIGILVNRETVAKTFDGFKFGDYKSSIWQLKVEDNYYLPQLSATEETIAFTQQKEPDILDTVTHYYGWKDIDLFEDGRTETIIKNDGSKQNPYIIYNMQSWNRCFAEDLYKNGYYRLVADIDFLGTAPQTSSMEFAGNIQGNGLKISNFILNTEDDLDAIGLFSQLNGLNNNYEENVVRNLTIENVNITAIKTQAVGVLAGIINNYKLYNISLDSPNILLGKNAAGGLAGVISGQMDIEKIWSNVSAHNDNPTSVTNYEVYSSKNNQTESNLGSVYYAGSVAGLVDAIPVGTSFDIANRKVSDGYSIRDITVYGDVLLISNTIGGAFGLINEYVNLTDVHVTITEGRGKLAGYQYSAGVVGENRGVINDASFVSYNDNTFASARATIAGVVGLNLGYIKDASAEFNAVWTDASANGNRNVNTILAGLVGRNAEGYIIDSTFDGNILSAWGRATEVTAGAIGADYVMNDFRGGIINQVVSSDVFRSFSYQNADGSEIYPRISNVVVSNEAIDFWLDNLGYVYNISSDINARYPFSISTSRLLAAGIGLLDYSSINQAGLKYGFNSEGFVLNYTNNVTSAQFGALQDVYMYCDSERQYSTPYANLFNYSTPDERVYMLYSIGSYVSDFDYWEINSYSCEIMLLANSFADIKQISISDAEVTIYRIATNINRTANLAYTIYTNLSDLQPESFTFNINMFFVEGDISVTDGNNATVECVASPPNYQIPIDTFIKDDEGNTIGLNSLVIAYNTTNMTINFN